MATRHHWASPVQSHNQIKPNSPLAMRPAGVPPGLIFLKAATDGCRHETGMLQPSTIVERLLAHARICREIADTSSNEETARKLEELAEDCIRAARDIKPAPQFH